MRVGFGVLIAAFVTVFINTPAMAQRHSKAGTLDCTLTPSVGLIIGSVQRMNSRFISNRGGKPECYAGTVRRLGFDLGITTTGRMVWVFLRAPGA